MALIKTSLVVAEVEATKIASLELKAPIGVGVDRKTGELSKIVTVKPAGEAVLRPTIIPGKLINEGFLEVVLTANNVDTTIFLPIYSLTKIEGIKSEDEVSQISEIEHISISGVPDTIPMGQTGFKTKIFVRALLKLLITVTRDGIISLPEEEIQSATTSDQIKESKQTTSNQKRSQSKRKKDQTWSRFWACMHH